MQITFRENVTQIRGGRGSVVFDFCFLFNFALTAWLCVCVCVCVLEFTFLNCLDFRKQEKSNSASKYIWNIGIVCDISWMATSFSSFSYDRINIIRFDTRFIDFANGHGTDTIPYSKLLHMCERLRNYAGAPTITLISGCSPTEKNDVSDVLVDVRR